MLMVYVKLKYTTKQPLKFLILQKIHPEKWSVILCNKSLKVDIKCLWLLICCCNCENFKTEDLLRSFSTNAVFFFCQPSINRILSVISIEEFPSYLVIEVKNSVHFYPIHYIFHEMNRHLPNYVPTSIQKPCFSKSINSVSLFCNFLYDYLNLVYWKVL